MLVKHNWEEQQEIRGLLGLKNEVYPISCVKFLAGGGLQKQGNRILQGLRLLMSDLAFSTVW